MPSPESLTPDQFHKEIQKAWYCSRPIIPIIGAGFSVDSGMPALASIVRYIAKLKTLLHYSLYGPPSCRALYQPIAELFYKQPETYLDAFGWPDRFQLNDDVWRGLHKLRHEFTQGLANPAAPGSYLQLAIESELNQLAKNINPVGTRAFEKLRLGEAMADVQGAIRANGTAKSRDQCRKALESLESIQSEFRGYDSFLYQLTADWKPLLRDVTGFRSDLIDALFARLAAGRQPGTAHLFLAHLCLLVRIKTIFTFNFDHLIEAGLESEQVPYRVFAMEHGIQLPSPTHLDETIALIKMHGSTHNILVDERVDYRLSEEYRRSFRALVGDSPLLLLMGCSGMDRRLRDLIATMLAENSKTTVIWMHRAESDDMPTVSDLGVRSASRQLHSYATFDVGQSLRSLYCSITDRLPPGRSAYRVKISVPHLRSDTARGLRQDRSSATRSLQDWELVKKPVQIIFPGKDKYAARVLLQKLCQLPLAYTRIWIDLEEHYTMPQVVEDILEQMRRRDSHISPYVASWNLKEPEDRDQAIEDAHRRITRALQRARYVLAITGLDAFGWQATTHHGTTSSTDLIANNMKQEREALHELLTKLVNRPGTWREGDSVLMLHWEHPYPRHPNSWDEQKQVEAFKNEFTKFTNKLCEHAKVLPNGACGDYFPGETQEFSGLFAYADEFRAPAATSMTPANTLFIRSLSMAVLACHRRTRITVGLRHIFNEFLNAVPNDVKHSPLADEMQAAFKLSEDGLPSFLSDRKFWSDLAEQPWYPKNFLLATESGLWFDRPWRDAIYDWNTRFTDSGTRQALSTNRNRIPDSLSQHVINAALHDLIARTYYLHLYLPSRDGFMFLEYVYHRISALRYLATMVSLLALLQETPQKANVDQATVLKRSLALEPLGGFVTMLRSAFGRGWKDFFETVAATADCANQFYGDGSDGNSGAAGASKPASTPSFAQLQGGLALVRQRIDAIRSRAIRGLSETWRRTEHELRTSLPAEQLAQWCDTLISYDFWSGEVGKPRLSRVCSREHDKDFLHELLHAVENIGDTWSKVCYERADFAEFRDCRKKVHGIARHVAQEGGIEPREDPHLDLDDWVATHWERFSRLQSDDDAEVSVARNPAAEHPAALDPVAVAPVTVDPDLAVVDPAAESQLAACQAASIPAQDPCHLNLDYAEADLRKKYLQIEVTISKFSHIGAPPTLTRRDAPSDTWPVDQTRDDLSQIDNALVEAREAIDTAREEHPLLDPRGLRDPMLEVTADQGLFIPYRALFLTLTGRLRMLRGLASRDIEAADMQFRHAFRDLSYARSGIGKENAILLAMAHLCSAEVCLAQVQSRYALEKNTGSDLEACVAHARAKLRSASGYLSRCYQEMLRGPRYALVWRFFHVTQLQYQLERIVLDIVERQFTLDARQERDRQVRAVGSLVDRVRKGLGAVRSCLDQTTSKDVRFRGHMRYQWGRLAAASIFSVMTEFVRFGRNDLLDVRLQRLEDYWYFLNESEGVRVQPKNWPQGVDCLTRPLLTDLASLRERISSVVRAERIEQVVQMRRWLLNDAAYLILRLDAPEGSPQVTIT